MNPQEFRKQAHHLIDWIADYLENIEKYPVKSQVQPREIYDLLPENPPVQGEDFAIIFKDFEDTILKGITHWKHPSFFAYFPANSSLPSLLGEILTAALGVQGMIWETSPAAAELEEKVMNWLKKMMEIPENFEGVIQDTASTGTLCAILTAREKISNYQINEKGFDNKKYRVYCSSQTHSSIDKAVKIAGLGKESLRSIETDEKFALIPEKLEQAIQEDVEKAFQPLCVVATIGTTSSTAIDPLRKIGEICQKHQIFLHVDAAYAGTAALLPEKRSFFDGLELADTYLFNPHKWMFTNFDCTAYFVKDKEALIRTFEILPEYLKTKNDSKVNNYRDWGIQLGRRFRALKLWFVIRSFGIEGLQTKLRHHLQLTQYLADKIKARSDFEILAPIDFNLICFRHKPKGITDEQELEQLNAKMMENINKSGRAYLTHTKLNDIFTLRIVIGQTEVAQRQVDAVWELILREII